MAVLTHCNDEEKYHKKVDLYVNEQEEQTINKAVEITRQSRNQFVTLATLNRAKEILTENGDQQ